MAIDERARRNLYLKAEEAFGAEAAAALMGLLPPVGWADVATKHDLDHVVEVNRLEHEQLRAEFKAALTEALQAQTFKILTFIRGYSLL
jgi:hypothetical protein